MTRSVSDAIKASFFAVFRGNRFSILLLLFLPVVTQLPALLGYYNPDPSFFTGDVGERAQVMRLGQPWSDPNVGYQGQALGKLSADLWLTGQVPWWNTYNGVGLPLAAEVQPGSLFMPFVLLYHYRAGGLWVETLLQIIAGLCTYALLRKLKLRGLGALAGALIFEFNGTFAWHGAPITTPVAFLPMLILGVEVLRERISGDASGGWVLISLALAWSIYAGFPETAYINGLLVVLWVLARQEGLNRQQQLVFISKLCLSVCVGLLCCVPLLIPFAEYLTRSYVGGGHSGAFAHAALPAAGFAVSTMPWLYGPIAGYSGSAEALLATWGGVGGYFTVLQVVLALLGVMLTPRKLSFVLLIWLLLCFGKTFDLRPISDLMNLLPMIKSAAFFRYSPPSWEFAGAVLVALAVDGLDRRVPLSRGRTLVVFAFGFLFSAFGLWLARNTLRELLATGSHQIYFFQAFAYSWLACSLLIGLALIVNRGLWPSYVRSLVLLLGIDACVAFALPIYSGAYEAHRDESGIGYLRAHIGLQRVYSLGPMAPNYGGYFQVSQINHNYLPVSKDWVDYIHKHLDPYAHFVTFVGEGWRTNHLPRVSEELRERRVAYEELGVKYVLASHGVDPFITTLSTSVNGSAQPLSMQDGKSIVLRWQLPASEHDRRVDQLDVLIGNYGGHSDGELRAVVCIQDIACASGEHGLRDSVDDTPLQIPLDRSLMLRARTAVVLTMTLSQEHSTSSVALWVSPISAGPGERLEMTGGPIGLAPELDLQLSPVDNMGGVRKVYSGRDMDIYELPGAKPYFEVSGGSCTLQVVSRLEVDADCKNDAQLLRREFYYPGWQATLNGRAEPLERAGELFQRVNLIAGKQRVIFVYRPSYFRFILLCFFGALVILLYGTWRELYKRPHSDST